MIFLAKNPSTHPRNERESRQAIAHVINRKAIVWAPLKGRATLLHGPARCYTTAWQIAWAMVPMLEDAGFRVNLRMPESATL